MGKFVQLKLTTKVLLFSVSSLILLGGLLTALVILELQDALGAQAIEREKVT
jgi:hypothetical protein